MSFENTLVFQVGSLTPSLQEHLQQVCERNQLELREELGADSEELDGVSLFIGELSASSRVVPEDLLAALDRASEAAALLFCNDRLLRPVVHLPGVPIQLARMPKGNAELESRILACLAGDGEPKSRQAAQGVTVRESSWRGGWAGWSYSGEAVRSSLVVVPGEEGPERIVALVRAGSDGPDTDTRLAEFCTAGENDHAVQREDEVFVSLDREAGLWSFARGKDAASPWLLSQRRIPQSTRPLDAMDSGASGSLSIPTLSGDVVLLLEGSLGEDDVNAILGKALEAGGPAALDALHSGMAGAESDFATLVFEVNA